jgi:hypothetical protein
VNIKVAASGPTRVWRNERKNSSSTIIAETTIAIRTHSGREAIHRIVEGTSVPLSGRPERWTSHRIPATTISTTTVTSHPAKPIRIPEEKSATGRSLRSLRNSAKGRRVERRK